MYRVCSSESNGMENWSWKKPTKKLTWKKKIKGGKKKSCKRSRGVVTLTQKELGWQLGVSGHQMR